MYLNEKSLNWIYIYIYNNKQQQLLLVSGLLLFSACNYELFRIYPVYEANINLPVNRACFSRVQEISIKPGELSKILQYLTVINRV
jgi:hypothetical protein